MIWPPLRRHGRGLWGELGSEFHPIGWYDLVIQPYQFLGHEPMSDLVHLRWCQVGNFAKLESNLSWHVLQKHLTLYLIILYFHINWMVFPHGNWWSPNLIMISTWDFPTELLQKLKKQLNDKMIQNVYYTYHSWVFLLCLFSTSR